MRQILIDYARKEKTKKRGEGKPHLQFSETIGLPSGDVFDIELILSIHQSLERLERLDSQQVRVVEMRFFGGMTFTEIGEALSTSASSAKREWYAARAWLYRELKGGGA